MKRLMIILLIGMLSLGLSGVAFAATDQTVDANVDATITLTAPTAISSWGLTPNPNSPAAGDNAKDTVGNSANDSTYEGIQVVSNVPYQLTIKCDDAASLATNAKSGYLNAYGTAYTSPAIVLTKPFYFMYKQSDGTISSGASTYTEVTTTDQTVVYITDAATDDDGYVTTVTYSQPVHSGDERLKTDTYHILITYTATSTL